MTYSQIALPLVFAALLASCSSHFTPQQDAFLHELADRPVTCMEGQDCDDKWNKAIAWVDKHSETGIRTITPNLIQTYLIYTEGHTERYPEFSVVRYKQHNQVFTITFTSSCDYGIACNPSALQRRADFVTSVLGPPPGVTVHGDTASKIVHTN